MSNVIGDSNKKEIPAISGENKADGYSIQGIAKAGVGVVGTAEAGIGVWGGSKTSSGVGGMSESGFGVHGVTKSNVGVRGDAESGDGVFGSGRRGVVGESPSFQGVFGKSQENAGVVGESDKLHGMFGICHNPNGAGVYGTNDAGGFGLQGESQNGIGVIAKGGRLAGLFQGDIEVTGDIRLVNADCAENFDITAEAICEPGSVMVLGNEGSLEECRNAYDKRVAGVLSGAGDYKPGIILDKTDTKKLRKPVALLGKVFCKVDANYGSIETGDLLTTSGTPGHAMKADDPYKAFGTVIGKALRPLNNGQGLIPILIALQ